MCVIQTTNQSHFKAYVKEHKGEYSREYLQKVYFLHVDHSRQARQCCIERCRTLSMLSVQYVKEKSRRPL